MSGKDKLKPEKVFQLVSRIPSGFVTTYKEIAISLGHPSGARVVGNILSQNSNLVSTPCHRVVKSDGSLGGYARGSEEKKKLLEKEGVVFFSKKRIDLKKHFFNFR